MRIVLASSEAVPFAKTGGLADVATALSKALSRQGHDVWLILPYYRLNAKAGEFNIEPTGCTITLNIGAKRVSAEIFRTKLPGSDVTVLLVDQPGYYQRDGLYQDNGRDFKDNCERFAFFSRAVLEAAQQLGLRPDVIHANDWQTGLIPALLAVEYRQRPGIETTSSVFTLHNMAFQGRFWHWDMLLTGLDWKYFNWRQMEFFGELNLLKTGIVFSDMITTVSPTYAREIQTAEYGCGLEGVLQSQREKLVGILNGVDTEEWNPAVDPHLARNYSVGSVSDGKPICKAALQKRMGLPANSAVPLFGMISRMTDQKGFDLIAECATEILQHDLQMVFLGTGEERYEHLLKRLSAEFPEKVAATIGFNEGLAHEIEAGADAYLMPSRFEPCGLNQMYSLVYGTVPVVRTVGGLADSVVDATAENLQSGTANGFRFDAYTSIELARQVRRALDAYHDHPTWQALIENGMRRDWSWNRSASEYIEVYQRAIERRHVVSVAQ